MTNPPLVKPKLTNATILSWHALVASRNTQALSALLADNVVFHSPVVHAPQLGKAITAQYLAAALKVFFNDSFEYGREIVGESEAALEFKVEIDGIAVNGLDLIAWDDAGKIIDFKVFIRPLKAVNLIHQKMAAMLQAGL